MTKTLSYIINNQMELNLSYMPFLKDGGLFIPTVEPYNLGETVMLNLQLPGQTQPQQISGEVVWITPKNALYQIDQGIGIQFKGENAKAISDQVKAHLDDTLDVGGYTYGFMSEVTQKPK